MDCSRRWEPHLPVALREGKLLLFGSWVSRAGFYELLQSSVISGRFVTCKILFLGVATDPSLHSLASFVVRDRRFYPSTSTVLTKAYFVAGSFTFELRAESTFNREK